MKVIMSVGEIPIGSTVSKITGEKQYIIQDKIKVYGDSALEKELKSGDNTRFLLAVTDSFCIEVVSHDKEMLWRVSEKDLYQYLYKIINK